MAINIQVSPIKEFPRPTTKPSPLILRLKIPPKGKFNTLGDLQAYNAYNASDNNCMASLIDDSEYQLDNILYQHTDDTKNFNNHQLTTHSLEIQKLLRLFDTTGNHTDPDRCWPTKSPYACWNCDRFFSHVPVGIPEYEQNGHYYCSGNFCSFSCGARYLKDFYPANEFWEKYSMMNTIYQKTFGLTPKDKLMLAPPKITLTKYGGTLTYDEYHKSYINGQSTMIKVFKMPLIPTAVYMSSLKKPMISDVKPYVNCSNHAKPVGLMNNPQRIQQAIENVKKHKEEEINNIVKSSKPSIYQWIKPKNKSG